MIILYLFVNVFIAGTIPSELCNYKLDVELNVEATGISCYSGCLTSQNIDINGANPNCANGEVTRRFIIISCIYMGICLLSAIWYKWYRNNIYCVCSFRCCDGPPSTNACIVCVLRYLYLLYYLVLVTLFVYVGLLSILHVLSLEYSRRI